MSRMVDDLRYQYSGNAYFYQVGTLADDAYKPWGASQPDNKGGSMNNRYPIEICSEVRMGVMVTVGTSQVGGLNDRDCRDRNFVMCVLDGEWRSLKNQAAIENC
jgi:hypothetical protein